MKARTGTWLLMLPLLLKSCYLPLMNYYVMLLWKNYYLLLLLLKNYYLLLLLLKNYYLI